MREAYLYRHIRLDTNQVFYVGIGYKRPNRVNEFERAHSVTGRNPHWKRVVAKAGYEIEIVLDGLTYETAKEKEIEFIALYGRSDKGMGPLVNKTDGGEGTKGVIHSKEAIAKRVAKNTGKKRTEETKEKLRASTIGRIYKTGMVCSEETKIKIRDSQKGIPRKKHSDETKELCRRISLGRKASDESRKKLSIAKLGKKQSDEHRKNWAIANACLLKPVICVTNGVEYPGVNEAGRLLGISKQNIRYSIKHNVQRLGLLFKSA